MATTCAARVACSHVGRGGSRFITAQKRNPCPARGAEQPPSPVAGPPSVPFVASSGHSAATGDGLLVGLCGRSRHTMRTAGMERSPDVRKKSTLNCCIHLLATAEYGRVDMGRAIRRLALSVPTFFAPTTRSVVPACGGYLQSLPVAMP